MLCWRRRRRGFTLLEALLALLILSAVMIVCLGMRSAALRSSARITATDQSQRVTQEIYESLIAGLLPDPEIDRDSGVRTWTSVHHGMPYVLVARPDVVRSPVAGIFPEKKLGDFVRVWRYELVLGSGDAAVHTEWLWRN